MKQLETVSTEVEGYILRIGLNRPEKLNSFNLQKTQRLGHGDNFTSGGNAMLHLLSGDRFDAAEASSRAPWSRSRP